MLRQCTIAMTAVIGLSSIVIAQTTPSPAELKKKYAERTAALHEAAEKGQVSLVLELLKAGADVNDKDDQGSTALHKAADKGNRSAAITLLMFGADVGEKDSKGLSPLHMAAASGHVELVRLFNSPHTFGQLAGDLIKGGAADALKGAGFNLKGASERFAALAGNVTSATDNLGQTPLMKAAANGHTDCVTAIGIYYDRVKDKQGRTTLMVAAMGGHTEMIRAVFAQAQPKIEYLQATDSSGKTAIQHAEAGKHEATVKLLKEMEQKALADQAREKIIAMAKENDVAGLKGELLKSDAKVVAHADLMVAAAALGNTQVVRFLMDLNKDKPVEEKVRLMGFPLGYQRPRSAFHLASGGNHLETLKAITELEWWNDKATLTDVLKRKDNGSDVYKTPLEMAANSVISNFIDKKFSELERKK